MPLKIQPVAYIAVGAPDTEKPFDSLFSSLGAVSSDDFADQCRPGLSGFGCLTVQPFDVIIREID